MEELFKELSKFTRENRKSLKLAEQWLNEFDGDLDDAWEVATNELSIDWRKIVLIVSSTLDEGEAFLLNTILSGTYTTKKHPSFHLIQNALEGGRKAVLLDENKPKEQEGQELHMIVLGKDKCNRGQSVKLLEQIINDTKREGVTCTGRAYKSFRKFFSKLGHTKMLEHISHDTKTKKITTTISVGKLFISK